MLYMMIDKVATGKGLVSGRPCLDTALLKTCPDLQYTHASLVLGAVPHFLPTTILV